MNISVVIPFHNTPTNYFRLCLQSLESQNWKNCEFILVDDWSDNEQTIELAKEFVSKDSRFIYVRDKEWGHEGGAREFGYHQARGEYVWFVDSDDQLANQSVLSYVMNYIIKYESPDVVLCEEKHFFHLEQHAIPMSEDASTQYLASHQRVLDAYASLDSKIIGNASPHNKIFKKSFLASVEFSCAKRVINADIIFVIVMALANTILYIDHIYYLVMNTPNSLTKLEVNKHRYKEVFALLNHVHQFYLLHYEAYQPIAGYMTNWVVGLAIYNRSIILSWRLNNTNDRTLIEKEYYQFLQRILPHYPVKMAKNRQMMRIQQSIYEHQELEEKAIHSQLSHYFWWENSKIYGINMVKGILPKNIYDFIKRAIKS